MFAFSRGPRFGSGRRRRPNGGNDLPPPDDRAAGTPPPDRGLARCPICGAKLQEPARRERNGGLIELPGLRLYVNLPADGSVPFDYMFEVIGAEDAICWQTDNYEPDEQFIRHTYLLCGQGHYFLESSPTLSTSDRFEPARWNLIAALGVPACGKSYVLTRMLGQELAVLSEIPGSNGEHEPLVLRGVATELEKAPLTKRQEAYGKTKAEGTPMPPTGAGTRPTPRILLDEYISGLPERIGDVLEEWMHPDLVGREPLAKTWGNRAIQPIVQRTEVRHGQSKVVASTCIADLPGELFAGQAASADQSMLGRFNCYVWVLDPTVTTELDPLLGELTDERDKVLVGALRPATVHAPERPRGNFRAPTDRLSAVRQERQEQQRHLAEVFSAIPREIPYLSQPDQAPQLMALTITKCDVIRLILERHRSNRRFDDQLPLDKLGTPRSVRTGINYFLKYVADWDESSRRLEESVRAGRVERGAVRPPIELDQNAEDLLSRLDAHNYDLPARESNFSRISTALVETFSDPGMFWDLVHTGKPITIPVADRHAPLIVPSLVEHLRAGLAGGQRRVIRMRDLVMSALGSGIAFGLGYGGNLEKLYQRGGGLELRVILASPLVSTPVGTSDSDLIRPLGTDPSFPSLYADSAGLSQLHLAALRGVLA